MIHAGHFEDTCFILDVESGSLHHVDELVYDIAHLMETGMVDGAEITSALSGKYPPTDIAEALEEIAELPGGRPF